MGRHADTDFFLATFEFITGTQIVITGMLPRYQDSFPIFDRRFLTGITSVLSFTISALFRVSETGK